jgi:anti-sigma regulatory factor (Ser/Thr protein kinase)
MSETFHKIFAANVDKLAEVTEFVEECADHFKLDAKKKFGLLVALEEAFVNICSYAYPNRDGLIEIFSEEDGDGFVLEITDSGNPFNVLSLPDPDLSLDIQDREIGGLGVYFIRRLTDNVSYRRENDRNILRLVLNRTS